MTKTLTLALIAAGVMAAAAHAQAPAPAAAPAPPPPRARGPALAVSVEAAQKAVATCLANGYKTTATVVDSAGVPVVMLAGDGAAERTQMIGLTKTWVVIKYKVPSGDIADKAMTDTALAAELKADPRIGQARRGALPIMAGGQLIGAMSVSGAPGGDKDEVCVKAALDSVGARMM